LAPHPVKNVHENNLSSVVAAPGPLVCLIAAAPGSEIVCNLPNPKIPQNKYYRIDSLHSS